LISLRRKLLAATFIVYLFLVAALTVIPTRIARPRVPRTNHINLVPLGYSFTCFLQDRRAQPRLTSFCLRNTLGNIALFLPLGTLLPLLFRRFREWKQVVLLAVFLSLSIETIQFFSAFIGNFRSVDIDDVILNTLGACVGFAIYWASGNSRQQTANSKQ
jgi:glycopeptide antibiotics resistance protein